MANQQLVDYIKAQIAAGASKPDIRKAVATAGWPLADIERAFMAADKPAALAPTPAPVVARPITQPQAQPVQSQPQPLAQPQPQEKPLPVIHMHPPGVWHSWWLWTLIILALLLALGAAAYFLTPVGVMVKNYFSPPPPAPVVVAPRIYNDASGSFSFEYPEGRVPTPKAIWEEEMPGGEIGTSSLPAGSVDIPGVAVVSKILLADMATSSSSAVYDYTSCCTGTRYWLDAASSTWRAQAIVYTNNSTSYKTLSLATTTPAGEGCTLARQIGPYTWYRIQSGDEGVPYQYYYYLLTDKPYVLRFMTTANFDATTTDPMTAQMFNGVVSSLKLIDSAPIQGHCA